MSLIFLGLTVLLLLINLVGAALLLRPWLPHYLLAKVIGTLGFCLVLFFIEHVIGLGQLTWLWPFTTAISLATMVVWRAEFKAGLWRQELVFVLGFAAALFWKFSFPDIDAHSEQLMDMAFITSYFSGETLPAMDYWLPDQRLNMYYTFQHYSAALLGRLLGLTPGYAMNLAIIMLMAMLASLAWFVVSGYCQPRWPRVVLVVALMAGGTGLAPLTHLIIDQAKPGQDQAFTATTNLWANVRFAGMYDADMVSNDLSRLLAPKPPTPSQPGIDTQSRDLPLETIGYLLFLGDFHPPLGGFLLLFLALACITVLEVPKPCCTEATPVSSRYLQMVLAATLPLTLITNTWVFPLHAGLLLGWVISRYVRKQPVDWFALVSGAVVASALIYPFLRQFAVQALALPINWVAPLDHTPLNQFIAIHWPALVVMLLAAVAAYRQRWLLSLLITLALMLLLSELFYVDDPMDGKYNRFNSALKWWSWLYPAILLGLGSMLLGAGRWLRWATVVVLLLVTAFSIDLALYWYHSDKSAMGKLTGNYWLSRDPVNKQILQWLQAAPSGIVLEGLDNGGAYTPTSAMALFAAKPSATGWPDHEAQWRGNPSFIYNNADKARAFYHGNVSDALSWLALQRVRYILWLKRDQDRDPQARVRIQQQISSAYYWKAFWRQGDEELGMWIKK